MKRILLHFLRCFLPVLFITYMASITFFAHVHVVDGATIVHSHPFKKGDAHKHSTLELHLIHCLSHLETDGNVPFFSLALFIPFLLCLLLTLPQYTRYFAPYYGGTALRAPPVRFS